MEQIKINIWNETLKIRNTTKDPEVKKLAQIYLNGMNTAAGTIILRAEVENFIKHNS